eukprot:c53078_g1_i1.p1 GENE.c53078_g1_i1~~c53078_g1_i1.p1  ORF type:complete len:859 (+),score=133.31 c53078_g1_i1:201-2579(+)
MNEADLRAHVESSLGSKFSSDLLVHINEQLKSGLACMDGRSDEAHLSAPGGDIGEFVIGLKVLEDLSGTQLTQFQVDDILVNVLASADRDAFHMCTDTTALKRLCQQTNYCFPREKFHSPSLEVQSKLLELLARPDFVGNQHLRLLLTHADVYGIRRELTEMAILSFFRILWNHLAVPLAPESFHALSRKLDLTVYEDEHDEEGVLSIVSSPKCQADTLLIKPLVNGHSMSVFYPDAVNLARAANAALLVEAAHRMRLPKIDGESPVSNAMTIIGNAWFLTTLDYYALDYMTASSLRGYPHYELIIPDGCCPTGFRRRADKVALLFSDEPLRRQQKSLKLACPVGSFNLRTSLESPAEDRLSLDGYSTREVAAHLGLNSRLPFEFVDAREWGVSGIDGRSMESILGVPGASVGQFALVLALAESQLNKPLDVIDSLARFLLNMQAPSFSYLVDVENLHTVCSHFGDCPSRELSSNEKMRQLVNAFQKPALSSQAELIAELSKVSSLGDAFLKFTAEDSFSAHASHLDKIESDLIAALQTALKGVNQHDAEQLRSEWQLTELELQVLTNVIGAFTPTMDQRQAGHVANAVKQCLHDNPELKDSITPHDAMKSCAQILKRLADYIVNDGELGTNDPKISLAKRKVRDMIPRVLEAFFRLLWGQVPQAYEHYAAAISSKLDLIVLDGSHHEHAFVTVRLGDGCRSTFAPLLAPRQAATDSSVWIFHPSAAQRYRDDVIDYLTTFDPHLNEHRNEIKKMAADIEDDLVRRFFGAKLNAQPIYDLVIGESCCPAGGE